MPALSRLELLSGRGINIGEQLTQIPPKLLAHVIFCYELGSFHLDWDRRSFLLGQDEVTRVRHAEPTRWPPKGSL